MVRNSSAIGFLSEREHEKMYGKEKAKHEEHYETGCPRSALALLPVSAFAAEFNAPGRISHL